MYESNATFIFLQSYRAELSCLPFYAANDGSGIVLLEQMRSYPPTLPRLFKQSALGV